MGPIPSSLAGMRDPSPSVNLPGAGGVESIVRGGAKFLVSSLLIGVFVGVVLTRVVLVSPKDTYSTVPSPAASSLREASSEGRAGSAYDFEAQDINPKSVSFGKSLRLSRLYEGNGVVVNFMASWCGPCRTELPALERIHAQGMAKVVCVASNEDGGSNALVAMIGASGLTLPVLFAPVEKAEILDEHYTHQIIPTTYLIDGRGRIREVLEGARSGRMLEEEIEKVLGTAETRSARAGDQGPERSRRRAALAIARTGC